MTTIHAMGTQSRPLPLMLVAGMSLLITFVILESMLGMMLVPDTKAVHIAIATLALLGGKLVALHFRPHLGAIETGIAIATSLLLGVAAAELASERRDDHEISATRYTAIATVLRERPSAAALLEGARADTVVTNAEYDRFLTDLVIADRNAVIGR